MKWFCSREIERINQLTKELHTSVEDNKENERIIIELRKERDALKSEKGTLIEEANSRIRKLNEDYDELKKLSEDTLSLKEKYDNLQASYGNLNSIYGEREHEYDELKKDHEIVLNDLERYKARISEMEPLQERLEAVISNGERIGEIARQQAERIAELEKIN